MLPTAPVTRWHVGLEDVASCLFGVADRADAFGERERGGVTGYGVAEVTELCNRVTTNESEDEPTWTSATPRLL